MKSAVAYVRVSTAAQGRSGLGLDAQKETIARFAATEGFEITAWFEEVETAKVPTPWTVARSSLKRSRSLARRKRQ